MVESLLAVLFVSFVLLVAFVLSRMLFFRIMLDHAASAAARARAVGFNDFMCFKTARAAMIPAAGRRTWPEPEAGWAFDEASRIPGYLASETPAAARGRLDYEGWGHASVSVNTVHGLAPYATARLRFDDGEISMDGSAQVEAHYPLYMNEEGW